MLVIRQSQMQCFDVESRVRFEQKLVQHFLKTYPRECRQAGGAGQIGALVAAAIERATGLGFTDQAQVSLFVAMSFILGCDFDRDPQIPWAGQILRNPAIRNLALRINAVYDRMLEYLEETAGQRCELVVRAMIRLRDWDISTSPPAGPDWGSNILDVFGKLYPQKLDYQGAQANRNLIEESLGKCEILYRFHSPEGKALFSILMFMLGCGFDHDPLHPWAARALADNRKSDEPDRVEALYRAARIHLEESLTND
ncbi:conserved hypothetical protein [Candidatus Sulfopaludibacter sp. SbA3]|nr:conserved hypothetical protein [Candidatus Sulfopaludibacter sp. SbA3]